MVTVAATLDGRMVPLPRPAILTRDWLIFAGVMFAAALLVAIDRAGYFGGRWDDGRYLDAALAWVERGPTLGTTHWALRWPTVLPTAASIELFGRNRGAAMLPFIAYFAGVLTVNFWAIRRFFDARTAALAVLALVTIGEVMMGVTRLTGELPELLFWSAGIWAFVAAAAASGTRQRNWLILAGIAAGLGWATRETAISLPLAFAAAFATGVGPRRARFGWLAVGFAVVALPEQLTLWHASGDWLYRMHVDLRHIEVPSNNLRGLVAHGQFAPMNGGVASRWLGIGPVHLFWAVDPWINLFLNMRYGLVFALAAGSAAWLALLGQRPRGGWTLVATIAALGALHVATVVYLIATDPKARMFMPAMAAAALILALCVVPLWRDRKARILIVTFGIVKVLTVIVAISVNGVFNRGYPVIAEEALAATTGPIGVNRWTRSRLALGPVALRARLSEALPPVGGLWLTSGNVNDDVRLDTLPPPEARWQVVRRVAGRETPFTLPLIALASGKPGAGLVAGFVPVMVLYRRLPDAPPPKPAPVR